MTALDTELQQTVPGLYDDLITARQLIADLVGMHLAERDQMWQEGYAFGHRDGYDAGYTASERDMDAHWQEIAHKIVTGGSRAIDQNNATTRRRLERELADVRRSLHLALEPNAALTNPQLERRAV